MTQLLCSLAVGLGVYLMRDDLAALVAKLGGIRAAVGAWWNKEKPTVEGLFTHKPADPNKAAMRAAYQFVEQAYDAKDYTAFMSAQKTINKFCPPPPAAATGAAK